MSWYLFAFICTIFIGIHLITSKRVLVFENGLEFLTVLATAQFVILIPIIPFVEIPPAEAFIFIFFQGLILAVGLFLQFSVLRKLPISTVAPLNNLMPLFLFSYAFFILGESLTNYKLFGLVILVSGAYLVDFSPKDFLQPIKKIFNSKYEQYLIIALMLLATVAMMDKLILTYKVSVISLLFFSQLFLAVSTFLILFIMEKKEGIKKAYSIKGSWVILTAFLKNLGNLAYFQAVSLTLVSLVLPFRQMASFFAALIGGSLFKEENLLRKSFACLIMILGVLLLIK